MCHPIGARLPGSDGWSRLRQAWKRTEIGSFVFHLHPETLVAQRADGGTCVALIGHAFTHRSVALGDPLAPVAAAAEAGWDDLIEVLDRTSGRFALLVERPDGAYFFHDPSGSRTVYRDCSGTGAIGSHAELLAMASGADRDRDIDALIASRVIRKQRMVAHLPGDASRFEGITALPPNHYIDMRDGRIVRFWPRHARRERRFDDFFGEIDDYFRGFADALRAPRRPIVGVTGGIDSRTLVAAFSQHGLDFRGLTWRSFNFEAWEAEPVRAIVDHLGIDHCEVDHSNDSIDEAARIGARNSGGYRPPSRPVAGMSRLFGDEPQAVFVRGMGAETLRGFYGRSPGSTPPALRPGPKRMLASLRRGSIPVFGSGPVRSTSARGMYRRYIAGVKKPRRIEPRFEAIALSRFRSFRRRAGYRGLAAYGYPIDDLFYWEHRMGMWASASLNASDPALDSMIGFNSRAVCEVAFGLPGAERLTKQLLVRVIERYDPQLAAIPYR